MIRKIRTAYNNLPLFRKILLGMLLVSLIPISVIGGLSISHAINLTADKFRLITHNGLADTARDLQTTIDQIRLETISLANNRDIIAALSGDRKSEYLGRDYAIKKNISHTRVRQLTFSISIFDPSGRHFSNISDMQILREQEKLFHSLKQH